MRMLRKTVPLLAATALSISAAACGEDRSGDVQFEGDTATSTTQTGTTGTTGTTETTETSTTP
jgi:lipopolysaccharide export system protein LptA